jgi:hypothetical protein
VEIVYHIPCCSLLDRQSAYLCDRVIIVCELNSRFKRPYHDRVLATAVQQASAMPHTGRVVKVRIYRIA